MITDLISSGKFNDYSKITTLKKDLKELIIKFENSNYIFEKFKRNLKENYTLIDFFTNMDSFDMNAFETKYIGYLNDYFINKFKDILNKDSSKKAIVLKKFKESMNFKDDGINEFTKSKFWKLFLD